MREDFSKAAAEGMRAAVSATRDIDEIDGVVRDLCNAVDHCTNGRVRVERITGDCGRLTANDFPLCKFREAPNGYPVSIEYPGCFDNASDREGLVTALRDLLASPRVGRFFNEVLGEPPPAGGVDE